MSKHIFDASEINAVKAVYYAHCAAAGITRNFDEEIADEDSDVVYYEGGNLVIISDPRVMVLFSEHLVENMVFYHMVVTRFMGIANAVRDFIKVIIPEAKVAFGKVKTMLNSIEELRIKGQGSASDWPFPIDQAAETPKAVE